MAKSLPGHAGTKTIVIRYQMESENQGAGHPHPGAPYHAIGFPRLAYLPDSEEGRRVLNMLVTAFRRRLIFTVGPSLTLGKEDCVTWAGIHHKTQMANHTRTGHGIPDLGFLENLGWRRRDCRP